MSEIFREILIYTYQIDWLEAGGLIFGLACVILLIRENIWTWPTGITYVLISFVIFYQAKLYADLALHVFFLALNIYGWYYWIFGKSEGEEDLPVTSTSSKFLGLICIFSMFGIVLCGFLLEGFTDASLPYWDSTTSILSIAGMWLTAKKKIENWYFWIIVDVLATGIYIYKGIYFYALLYFIYIGLAVSGFLAWKRSMQSTPITTS